MELRQYTLQRGQREVLVELFDREFVETQEAVGMHVIGQFRDVERPDRFVWLRGFPDMELRRTALEAFYGGPVWRSHRDAANATMIDVDDVLLLRPLLPTSGFGPMPERPAPGVEAPAAMLVATICSLRRPADAALLERTLLPALETTVSPLAVFVEEPSDNTFPALPVRTGEHVIVWFQRAALGDDGSHAEQIQASVEIARRTVPDLVTTPVQVRLEPTPRSRLR
ncbi:MAG: NIPSNAP family protein [Ilumatobacteraceae bacterium]